MGRRKKNIQLYIFAAIGYLTTAVIGSYLFYMAFQGIIVTWFTK